VFLRNTRRRMATGWQIKNDLQKAILDCSERCLYISMKWYGISLRCLPLTIGFRWQSTRRAAELLDGIDYDKVNASEDYSDSTQSSNEYRSLDSSLTELENNKYLYARALFEVRQFDNAAFVLSQFTAPKLRFLRLYAKYLVTSPLTY
jgi:anaphase-promoting complex subunit 8